MAFITSLGTFISFAEYADVTARDQRLFESNEGLTEAIVEELLEQGSQRVLTKIKATDWWKDSQFEYDSSLNRDPRLVPVVDPLRIESRQQDFTDLTVYLTLTEYVLPKIADFTDDGNADVKKIQFYKDKFDQLFKELLEDGSWYDFNDNGVISTVEKKPSLQNLIRVR